MYGWVLSWGRIEPFLLTSAGCKCCGFQCISSICWAYFSDVMVSPGFRKLLWIRQQTTKQWPWHFFGASLALGSALEHLLSPTIELVVTRCCIQSTFHHTFEWIFPGGSDSKESPYNMGDLGSIPGWGRSPGEGNGTPLQYSCLENPWTEKPGRLQSMGSLRVRHNWSDLAAPASAAT